MSEAEIVEYLAGAPNGDFKSTLDEKGRVRINSEWVAFITEVLKDKTVYVTSLDGVTIRIYATSVWRINANRLLDAAEDDEEAEAVNWNIQRYGHESGIDPTGRVLLKQSLREHLKVEKGAPFIAIRRKGYIEMRREEDTREIREKVDSMSSHDLKKAAAKFKLL